MLLEGQAATLLPIVRWAQRKETISLKVELQECKYPNITLKSDSIKFQATGVGAKGENCYEFVLDFFKSIDSESCVHKVTGSSVEIFLTKDGSGEWWHRLTKQKSPHFLKLDFEKWRSESDDEEDKMKHTESTYLEELRNEKKLFENRVDVLRRGYLIIYNMVQFLAHCYIFFFCTINLVRGGAKIFPLTYDRIGNAVHFAVMLSCMEIIHPLAGVMKGAWVTPLLQVFGRNFALFCLWLAADFIKHEWFVTVLFISWSGIELVRYPFYICQLGNISAKVLTWLRYTIWIPVYPLGVLMEAILFMKASHAFDDHNMYALKMPNSYNTTFKFSWVVRLYIALLFYAIGMILIPHMWKMRQRRVGGRRKYKQP